MYSMALVACLLPTLMGQSSERLHPAFTPREIRMPDESVCKYAIFLPADYDQQADKTWPVILFLHGSGEVGRDGVMQTTVGLPNHIARQRRSFPFITIMPQAQTMWFREKDEAMVWAILEREMHELKADADRLYITGLSMGGYATWDLICKRPDLFAAAAPVCGVGTPGVISNARHLPIWAFHGVEDKAVPVAGTRQPIAALRLLGAQPKYTEYADGDHFIWDRAYGDKQLYTWLLSNKRPPPPAKIEYVMLSPMARVWWLTLVAPPQAAEQLPRASAEVLTDGNVVLQTQGVGAWAIASNEPPLKTGDEIELTWNGQPAFKGKFPGIITYAPKLPTTQPANDRQNATE